MSVIQRSFLYALLILSAPSAVVSQTSAEDSAGQQQFPVFGCDTVLVWKTQNRDYTSEFVVRIAEFAPNRFFEWEDMKTQGTIFLPKSDVLEAKGYISSRLFQSGMDTRSKNATTLWLSRKAFLDLKKTKKIKHKIDNVQGWIRYEGDNQITVKLNRSLTTLPVIKTMDDRGSERWFLDQEENPLMVKHLFRTYDQTLDSITTDRSNTLRWIKGRKLSNPPR